jgi:hypothetical protein
MKYYLPKQNFVFNVYGPVHRNNIVIYTQQDATLHSLFFWKLLYMFLVVPPTIIRSANNSIYSIWYLSHRYCYLPLSWKSCDWFECAVLCCRCAPDGHLLRVTIPDAVLIQFDLLRMGKILLETCTCREL